MYVYGLGIYLYGSQANEPFPLRIIPFPMRIWNMFSSCFVYMLYNNIHTHTVHMECVSIIHISIHQVNNNAMERERERERRRKKPSMNHTNVRRQCERACLCIELQLIVDSAERRHQRLLEQSPSTDPNQPNGIGGKRDRTTTTNGNDDEPTKTTIQNNIKSNRESGMRGKKINKTILGTARKISRAIHSVCMALVYRTLSSYVHRIFRFQIIRIGENSV